MAYRELTREEFDALSGRILYEDNHLLIVNKLSGEITQGDKTGDECLADTYKAFIAQRDNKPGQVEDLRLRSSVLSKVRQLINGRDRI